MIRSTPADLARGLRLGGALLVLSLTLGGCMHSAEDVTASIPNDHRLRHPIAIQEADRTVTVFVGNSRGGLTVSQRADVAELAQSWLREGTGAIVAEVPIDTPNARAAADSMREIQHMLTAHGIPPRGVTVRNYRPVDPRQFAAIRLNYPRIAATAGPCGTWPEDLGPSIKNKSYLDNKPYFNLGCAQHRNLAAMVANPTDLVQPRAEAPVYAARRSYMIDKYRQGQSTATTYPDPNKNSISSVGQ